MESHITTALIGAIAVILAAIISIIPNMIGPEIQPPSSLPTSESEFIDNYVKSLMNGWLIFNPPKEMTCNISESINAIITKENISESGEPIKVGPYMEVSLKGSAFDIVPITESRQFIASYGPTAWKWDVIPKKVGNQTLDLLAYVIIEMPDGHEEKRALVKSKAVFVNVNPLDKQGRYDFLPALFEGRWAKVITALGGFLAFIMLFFKEDILAWIRSKREPPKLDEED